jgi:hypothetical protein
MMITNDCFENSKRVKNMTFDKIYNNLKSLVRVALASTHIYIYIYIYRNVTKKNGKNE